MHNAIVTFCFNVKVMYATVAFPLNLVALNPLEKLNSETARESKSERDGWQRG